MATLLFGSVRNADETRPMASNAPGTRVPAGEDQVATAATELAPSHHRSSMQRSEAPPPAPTSTRPPAPVPGPSPAQRWGSSLPSIPPQLGPRSRHQHSALPAMVAGLVWTAVVWLGLAICMIAIAYPFSTSARFWLLMAGTWLIAGGAAYAFTTRPEAAA